MSDFNLRAARADDAEALTRIHIDGKAAIPLPPSHRAFAEIVGYHARLIAGTDVRVAVEGADMPIGYTAREDDVLAQFYLTPTRFRRGIGAALLRETSKRAAAPLLFWCFAHNARAIAFYTRFGAVEIDREGPEANEERMPAIRFRLPLLT